MKRIIDVVLGALLALAATPVVLLLAIGTAITFRAWPFFVQRRVGEGGRLFPFPKLRTLPPGTPRYATKDALPDVVVPRFADFLRRSHLDELPQLFLVPVGWMSLVGPRPKMPDEYEPVNPVYGEIRQTVPQGCTCLWQIGRDTEFLPSEAPEYDTFYVAHKGWRLDAVILWWTALSMVGLGRAHGLDDVPRWARRGSHQADHLKEPHIDIELALSAIEASS